MATQKQASVTSPSAASVTPVATFRACEVRRAGWNLSFTTPIEVEIRFDREAQLFLAELHDIGVDACNTSLARLHADIEEQIVVAWEVYTQAEDTQLTQDAKSIKYNLLALVGEASRALESEESSGST